MAFMQRRSPSVSPAREDSQNKLIGHDFNNMSFQEALLRMSLGKLSERLPVLNALEFAKQKHTGQKRDDSGVPYVIHPIRVCKSLIREFGVRDTQVLSASLMHDTIEDCGVTEDEITRLFGMGVAFLVKSVSKNCFPDIESYYGSIAQSSVQVKMIKLADRIDNLRSLFDNTKWTPQRVARYARDSREHVLPLTDSMEGPARQTLLELITKLEGSEAH